MTWNTFSLFTAVLLGACRSNQLIIDCPDWYRDGDGDGAWVFATKGTCEEATSSDLLPSTDPRTREVDCDDEIAAIHPGAPESCDEPDVDHDCDGIPAKDDPDSTGFVEAFLDQDGDGSGIGAAIPTCRLAPNQALLAGDCDDLDPDRHPDADETCDHPDQDRDCDGLLPAEDPDTLDRTLWYRDDDRDGHGDRNAELTNPNDPRWLLSCDDTPPSGFAAAADDCQDDNANVHPARSELCNSIDDDCDDLTDNEDPDVDAETGGTMWYRDLDGDLFGDAQAPWTACPTLPTPPGYVAVSGDCQDQNPLIKPGAPEICNAEDDDCDGYVDLADPTWAGAPPVRWYTDADGDGWGTGEGNERCLGPMEGEVDTPGDCEDGDSGRHPNAAESCDAPDEDRDCDGTPANTDADTPARTSWFIDADNDGVGTGDPIVACAQPAGTSPVGGDCDDHEARISPGLEETCDRLDNDCDGLIDAADPDGEADVAWYRDTDGDLHGDPSSRLVSCAGAPATGWVTSGGDCNDLDPAAHPGATETCDAPNSDRDCDGQIAADEPSAWITTHPDRDRDGAGDATVTLRACPDLRADPPRVVDASDCDDADPNTHPDARESCDAPAEDRDCDGSLALEEAEGGAAVDGAATRYLDRDRDGYGDDQDPGRRTCPSDGLVLRQGDCDDQRDEAHPTAVEQCNGEDDDCDGTSDNGLPSQAWYTDADGDGWGAGEPTTSCATSIVGQVGVGGDCDDANRAAYPGLAELCDGIDNDCDLAVDDGLPQNTWYTDADGDGWGDEATMQVTCQARAADQVDRADDCDDLDRYVAPTEVEVCDGLDNDCDGTADDGLRLNTWYTDADGDGWGDDATREVTCHDRAAAQVARGGDCRDSDPSVAPGLDEVCDGLDNDCDGAIDAADLDGPDLHTWYTDADGDGWGDAAVTTCREARPDQVSRGGDCDDADRNAAPGLDEVCDGIDNDCDLAVDAGDPSYAGAPELAWYADLDGDEVGAGAPERTCGGSPGPSWVTLSGDCDDTRADILPGAPESCQDLNADHNCDGVSARDQLAVVPGARTLFADTDGDGHGAVGAAPQLACDAPLLSPDATDCDDTHPGIHPGAPEVCDTVDDDCDGVIQESGIGVTWYADADGDRHGDASAPVFVCDPLLTSGAVQDSTDCDDGDPTVHPGAAELCGGGDEDCSRAFDDVAPGGSTPDWFVDADGDGLGAGTPIWACAAPAGAVAEPGDCDDDAAAAHPGGREVCDGLDNDCNGLVDNAEGRVGLSGATTPWYPDADHDGHGGSAGVILACAGPAAPAGHAAQRDDCDDADASIHPGAQERCNDLDDDCDRLIDSADLDVSTDPLAAGAEVLWLPDADGDHFGVATGARYACDDGPLDHVTTGFDCDDGEPQVYPGAPETCDEPEVDHDCDGVAAALSASPVGAVTLYRDRDEDGYGSTPVSAGCLVDGWSDLHGDCDDLEPAVRPGAPELCNGDDDDCDLLVDDADPGVSVGSASTAWRDEDGDGFGDAAFTRGFCSVVPAGHVTEATDCDDHNAAVSPGATEVCNDLDDNCDALVDEADPSVVPTAWYADGDGDHHGGGAPMLDCTQPAGRSADGSDCDDTRARVFPGAPERCDGLDNDCDGAVDNADADSPPGDGTKLWNADLDGDGFGDPDDGQVLACNEATPPPGFAASNDDCDNGDAFVHPGAQEVCNAGVDDDCDGLQDSEDEDVFGDPSADVVWYADADGDGFVSSVAGIAACANPPEGYLAPPANLAFDCDDEDESSYPGAPELCDEVDQDCDEGRTWNFDTVAFQPASGSPVDLTACLTGTTDVPGLCATGDLDTITPGEGVLHFCQRTVDRYRLRIQTSVPLEVHGHHEAAGEAVLTNKEAGGTRHDWVIQSTSELLLQDLVIRDSGHKDVDQARAAVDHNVTVARALTILRCDFIDNGAGSGAAVQPNGGGAVWSYGTPVLIEGSTFTGNNSAHSPVKVWPEIVGIAVSSLTIRRSTFTENISTAGNGGAIYTFGPSVLMEDVHFDRNSASAGGYGGAAHLNDGTDGFYPSVTLRDVHFDSNAGHRGGALYVEAPNITLFGTDGPSTFTHNAISSDAGGAVYLLGQDIDIANVLLSDNQGTTGSAMFVQSLNSSAATLDIDQAEFLRNFSPSQAALFINQPGGVTTNISNSTFSDNSALYASAMYAYSATTLRNTSFVRNNSSSNIDSAAINFNSLDHLRLEDVDLEDNIGGGIAAYSSSDVTLTECTLTRNISNKNAAAIDIRPAAGNSRQGTLHVSNTTFTEHENTNTALAGGAVYLSTHAVSNQTTPTYTATFEGCSFTDNEAAGPAGAIRAYGGVALTLDDVDFSGNYSRLHQGSAVSLLYDPVTGDPTLTLLGTCSFDDNTPDDIWASAVGPIDYTHQTSCTAQTGCTP